ncbi:uncharacterized protein LOC134775311 [Penaeus indicus]|uniref:uncharacterized protein LOC134775311 n=1 Tax=Penaeus indicus TaxID=29960 RepID=UPI00300D8BDE
MYWKTKLVLLSFVICVITCYDTYSNDEEDVNYYLGRLYEESDDGIDPHDMLSGPGQRRVPGKRKEMPFSGRWTADRDGKDTESCSFDKDALSKEQTKFAQCQEEKEKLKQSVESHDLTVCYLKCTHIGCWEQAINSLITALPSLSQKLGWTFDPWYFIIREQMPMGYIATSTLCFQLQRSLIMSFQAGPQSISSSSL